MKAKPMLVTADGYSPCEVSEATHVMLHMPGCFPNRIIPVKNPKCQNGWTWNGSVDSPTLQPSILTKGGPYLDGEKPEKICHSFVTDGQVQFLGDCTHEFAGQTVSLLEVD